MMTCSGGRPGSGRRVGAGGAGVCGGWPFRIAPIHPVPPDRFLRRHQPSLDAPADNGMKSSMGSGTFSCPSLNATFWTRPPKATC